MRPEFPDEWRACAAVERWRGGLLNVTGLAPAEVEAREAALFEFCRAHACSPMLMAEECRDGGERHERRGFYLRLARASPANLVVQSFLVHNGVNVFGEIVCMPSTRSQIVREQGQQWIRGDAEV